MKRLSAVLLILMATLGLAACGSGSTNDNDDSGDTGGGGSGPLTIGFAIGETGFMQAYDEPARTAAEFAMEDFNAEGGIEGRKVKFVSADMKSKPELSGDAATQVLSDGAEIVVTSCDFDQGAPAAVVAQEAGVLAFSTCAASTAFGPEGVGPLAFTEATAAGDFGASIAEWAFEKKGFKNAFMLWDNTLEYMKQSSYGFKKRWEEIGGNLVGEATFKQEDQSIASQINEIKSLPEPPEAIYLTSYMPGLASAVKQIRAAGLEMPILSDEDIDGDSWKSAVPELNDIYFTTNASLYGDDPEKEVQELVDRYKEKTGKLPEFASFLTGYTMMEAIKTAMEGTGGSSDGPELQAQLEKFDEEPLLLPTTFTPKYHITLKRTVRVMQIQDAKTSYVESWTPKVTPVPDGS
jgi:branched-chain amino acid transport system substrate-binding protein